MAAREAIHSLFEAQHILRPRPSAVATPGRVPRLKTHRALLLLFPDRPRNHEHARVLSSDAHADTDAETF
jgi:hypothetical protein